MTNAYEEFIADGIATALNKSSASLQPVFSELPGDDADIFSLFDLVPSDTDPTNFSTVFGQILTAQPESPFLPIAKSNFENPDNWLMPDTQKIAKYTPTRDEIVSTIKNSPSISFHSNAQEQARSVEIIRPKLPSLENGILPNDVDWSKAKVQSYSLHLEHAALMSIRQGAWFNPSVFSNAYSNKNWEPNPSDVTWDNVFGEGGSLTSISTGAVVGAGMNLQMTIVSEDKNGPTSEPVWPFSGNIQGGVFNATLSLEISVTTPKSIPLLLALENHTVAELFG